MDTTGMMENGPVFDEQESLLDKYRRLHKEFCARLIGPPAPAFIRQAQERAKQRESQLRYERQKKDVLARAIAQTIELHTKRTIQ